MSNSFKDFKKNRTKNAEAVKSAMTESDSKDERFWKATVDKAGNGFAVIRFLPAPEGETMPFVHLWNHGFKGPSGKWYIENSLSSLGKNIADPVSEANSALWNQNKDENCPDKKVARERKRNLNYYANILVVKDPACPDNEGKVFLYRFGKKIYEKVQAKLKPEYEGESSVTVYDFWEGANFKLKIKQKGGFWNYDDSEFEPVSALMDGDDEKLEALWKTEHSLEAITAPENFKTYAELKKRFIETVGLDDKAVRLMGWADAGEAAPAKSEKTAQAKAIPTAEEDDIPFDVDDEDMDYFSKAAGESA